MRKPRKKISQREAHRLRRRMVYLERMVRIYTATPFPKWEVCHFSLTDAMEREVVAVGRFGAVLRAEKSGSLIQIFAYKPEATP